MGDYQAVYFIYALIPHIKLGWAIIAVNLKHLSNLDELQRKITMDAMGISLEIGLIAGIAYEQLEEIKFVSYLPEISHFIMLMVITYIITIFFGNRKYN
jgi:hypothetical protein